VVDIAASVTRVVGKCDAGLREGDAFVVRGPAIEPLGHDRRCQVAFGTITLNLGRVRLDPSGVILVSCPDPGTGEGGNVTFRLEGPAGANGQAGRQDELGLTFRPVEITGECPAGLNKDSAFAVEGMRVTGEHSAPCLAALAHWPPVTWQLQAGRRFFAHVSCPGCTHPSGRENRVVFLAAHTARWELSLTISRYIRLARLVPEPDRAAALKIEAIRLQAQRDFAGAHERMREALALLEMTHVP
jgi:uncharacterized repeat protein (TIGR04076 family)